MWVDATHQIREAVEPVRSALFQALDVGTEALVDICDERGIEDPWYRAHTVRLFARQELEMDESGAWSIDRTVANSGIHLTVPGARIRVLKGTLATAPNPGKNRTRREFWDNDLPYDASTGQYLLNFNLNESLRADRLLVLWDQDDLGEIVLAAAAPRGAWPFQGIPILGPTTMLAPSWIADGGAFAGADDDGRDLVYDPAAAALEDQEAPGAP
jgi:hypothetical protein